MEGWVRVLRFRATCWHYNLAQFYGPGHVVVKIRWDELSHMGLNTHKVVLLWYLVNGVISIERCHRVIHEGDGRMHFSEALMHDEIAPLRGCERDLMAQFDGIVINIRKIERFTQMKNYMF